MEKINFEVGKFYIDGHGNKWECLKTDLKTYHPIVMTNNVTIRTYTEEGVNITDKRSLDNIVSEYVEKPIVDWSFMPVWANWVLLTSQNKWVYCMDKPDLGNDFFYFNRNVSEENMGFNFIEIPSQYAPKFEGDWKESLVERPK